MKNKYTAQECIPGVGFKRIAGDKDFSSLTDAETELELYMGLNDIDTGRVIKGAIFLGHNSELVLRRVVNESGVTFEKDYE